MKNLFSRLFAIEQEMEQAGHNGKVFMFSNGDTITLTEEQVQAMFSDTINRKPNENAAFFLERLKAGHTDENGLVYSLSAYAADPAELWGDEIPNSEDK